MKIVSENLKKALKKPTTQRKGRILVNGSYYNVYNVNIYADCYDDGKVIGNAIASQLDFDMAYIDKFDTFEYEDGVWVGDKYEYVNFGTFKVFDGKNDDNFTRHITAFDNLINFNASFIDKKDYPKTMFSELQNICQQAKVGLLNTAIPNGDFILENNQFVNGENLKAVLKEICRNSGTYAVIKKDKVVLQLKNITNEKINKSQHEPVIWKRKTYGINKVVMGMADVEGEYVVREDKKDIAINGVHQLIINDSVFGYTQDKRNALIDGIFNQVKGFGYIPYEVRGEWLNYLEIGDTINLDGVDTIVLRINGKSPKGLESTISAPAIIDNSLEYVNNTETIENKVKRTEIVVDKQNQRIDALASKITDISKVAKGVGSVILENASEGQLYKLVIRGALQDFPSKNLFPSSTLFPKSSSLIVEHGGESIKYPLPHLELRYHQGVYDELVIEDSHAIKVKRLEYHENDNTITILPKPIEEALGDVNIVLKEGTNRLYLESFPDAQLDATYLIKNEYTNTFATKVELDSKLTIQADQINSEVSKKVGKDEVVSTINQSAEQITLKGNRVVIESNNFNLTGDGTATMKNAVIDGGDINLKNGAKITGDNGLITNLIYPGFTRGNMFLGSGDYLPLGHAGGGDTLDTQNNALVFNFKLPKNFTIKSAKVYLTHAPITWKYEGRAVTGYSRNLNLYKVLSTDLQVDLETFYAPHSSSYELIPNAFGGGFTGSAYGLSNAESIDIKNAISSTESNQLAVKTSDGVLYGNDAIFGQTGGIVGYLEVIGFTNFEPNDIINIERTDIK